MAELTEQQLEEDIKDYKAKAFDAMALQTQLQNEINKLVQPYQQDFNRLEQEKQNHLRAIEECVRKISKLRNPVIAPPLELTPEG
jgi:DNA repair ATPase RecN